MPQTRVTIPFYCIEDKETQCAYFNAFCHILHGHHLCDFVASLSFWVVQKASRKSIQAITQYGNQLIGQFTQRPTSGRRKAVRDLLQRWETHPAARSVMVVTSSDYKDLLQRKVSHEEIENAYQYAMKTPTTIWRWFTMTHLAKNTCFFIRHFDRSQIERMPSPLLIPGLPLAPFWHELIILSSTLAIGLLLAYILASNISQPIRILEHGMNRLAAGELTHAFRHNWTTAKTNLPIWAFSLTKWQHNYKTGGKKNAIYCTMFHTKCVRPWRVCRRLWACWKPSRKITTNTSHVWKANWRAWTFWWANCSHCHVWKPPICPWKRTHSHCGIHAANCGRQPIGCQPNAAYCGFRSENLDKSPFWWQWKLPLSRFWQCDSQCDELQPTRQHN